MKSAIQDINFTAEFCGKCNFSDMFATQYIYLFESQINLCLSDEKGAIQLNTIATRWIFMRLVAHGGIHLQNYQIHLYKIKSAHKYCPSSH